MAFARVTSATVDEVMELLAEGRHVALYFHNMDGEPWSVDLEQNEDWVTLDWAPVGMIGAEATEHLDKWQAKRRIDDVFADDPQREVYAE